jgi:putative ABC transport system substrate-binding protein
MRQRDLIVLLGGAATWPLGARAQTVPVIGILGSAVPQQWTARLRAFREGLGEMGYVEGRNVVMEYRGRKGITSGYQRLRPTSSRSNPL